MYQPIWHSWGAPTNNDCYSSNIMCNVLSEPGTDTIPSTIHIHTVHVSMLGTFFIFCPHPFTLPTHYMYVSVSLQAIMLELWASAPSWRSLSRSLAITVRWSILGQGLTPHTGSYKKRDVLLTCSWRLTSLQWPPEKLTTSSRCR